MSPNPREWSSPEFWDRWDRIYVAPSAEISDLELKVLRGASRPVLRLAPKECDSWFRRLGTACANDEFADAFEAAEEVQEILSVEDHRFGRFAFEPIDVGRAFHNGNLYYPVRTLVRELHAGKDKGKSEVQSIEIVVVCSDGMVLSAQYMPAKPGTPVASRVLRLTDGTLIDEEPSPSRFSSWRWSGIQRWMAARRNNEEISRGLCSLVADVSAALVEAVWLANASD